ncbi:HlyC/CorC family transporter [Pseudonocardia sp. KRD-182]|uniref:hemolysin family protein n=1 Tax=Pseudonocardia oceani TaxID=2792013 RepID=UPI001C4A5F25|nr:hemolysin family protein [Pseudonocardia oceani]MBW0109375.1 HlyC/CorC family transporter [Pseudonocardia oceani]
MDDGAAILVALVLLAANAFFVGAEFALISARRTQIEPRAERGSRAATITLRAMEKVSLNMACAQLGITACSLGLGAIGEPAVAHLLEVPFAAVGLPEPLVYPVSFTIALSIVVFLHMVLGEMVPKNIAIAGPERAALVLGPPLALITSVLKPAILLLNGTSNLVLKLMKVTPRDEVATTFTSDEVAGLIAESRQQGLLDDDEEDLLTGALEFEELTVGSVVLPRDGLVVIDADATGVQVQEATAGSGFSRFPVIGLDGDPVGYLHVKDALHRRGDTRTAGELARPLPALGRDDPLRDALTVMRDAGAHLAAVTGPDGELAGVVALEDVLERLVGHISDGAAAPVVPRRGT